MHPQKPVHGTRLAMTPWHGNAFCNYWIILRGIIGGLSSKKFCITPTEDLTPEDWWYFAWSGKVIEIIWISSHPWIPLTEGQQYNYKNSQRVVVFRAISKWLIEIYCGRGAGRLRTRISICYHQVYMTTAITLTGLPVNFTPSHNYQLFIHPQWPWLMELKWDLWVILS